MNNQTRPEPYTDPSPVKAPTAMPSGACEVGDITEPHYLTLTYLCEVPAGAQLMAFRNRVFVVAPGMAPQYVTPTGLKPVQVAEGPAQG